MDMVMTMERSPKKYKHLLCSLSLITTGSFAADVTFSPVVGGGLTFTDNVDLVESGSGSSLISSIDVGVAASVIGNDGQLNLAYTMSQLFYSHDSSENAAYQQLNFLTRKGLYNTGFSVDVSASIENIAEAIDENASVDVFTGNTIESKNAQVGVSYHSNPLSKVDLRARTYAQITNNEDDIGNYDGYGAEITYANGRSVKDFFWLIEASYDYKNGKNGDEDTSFTLLREEFGLQTIHGWSPLIRLNYENYEGRAKSDSADSFSWGPGLRYYWTKQSYIEVSYNFSDDDNNSDFWAGAINVEPNTRTKLFFSYDKRFFGDAYQFELSHRSRKLTNSISYFEEAVSFDRDFFTSGSNISEVSLSRRLEWSSVVKARRTSYELSIFHDEQQVLNANADVQDEEGNGIGLDISHRLSRRLSMRLGAEYKYYDFERLSEADQRDHYQDYSLGASYQLNDDISTSFNLSHMNKSSSKLNESYDENRVFINVRMQL
ncbi:TIGR03016 family PEP-CTERM system-associated outer membrane protein [Photobacterium makurazakiensis]|uniref:TIGR03016 family PEP-CTERM system-associated outer membrane protein n=1 Tax=Photobacterium makurazakiensis TaxID=2910234 RepID=UPI003D0ACDE2